MNSLLSVIASIGPGKASKLYRGLSICQLCGCSMYPPSEKENFCWVFELPLNFPSGFTFPNALPAEIMLIDYFHPI